MRKVWKGCHIFLEASITAPPTLNPDDISFSPSITINPPTSHQTSFVPLAIDTITQTRVFDSTSLLQNVVRRPDTDDYRPQRRSVLPHRPPASMDATPRNPGRDPGVGKMMDRGSPAIERWHQAYDMYRSRTVR